MSALKFYFSFCCVFFFLTLARAEEINASYTAGLKSYQDSKFEQAKQDFVTALQEEPQNPFINYNLALTEWKLGHLGISLALLRRAQHVDPTFEDAFRAESSIREGLKVKDLPHQISLWETIRTQLLKNLSVNSLLGVLALVLAVTAYTGPKFLGARRRNTIEGTGIPPNPTAFVVSCILTLIVMVTTGLKFFDLTRNRGTIVVEKVEALSGPEAGASGLFELFEGLEVIVRRTYLDSNNKEWVQVTYPGGMTGWVLAENLVSHSDATLRTL
jgi:hypothetical protein